MRWYASAIGETDPVYHDVAAARAAGHRSLLVPPTFLSCMEGWLFKTFDLLAMARVEPSRVLHAEQQYDYHAPFYAGDTLTYEPRIVDVYDKKGGRARVSGQGIPHHQPGRRACGRCALRAGPAPALKETQP